MDDLRIGAALRAMRVRKRQRQADVAARAGVSASVVGRVERGGAAGVPLGKLRRIFRAVDARLDAFVRFEGAEPDRLLDGRHTAMHEAIIGLFEALEGWIVEPEVSFSVYGERGVIDILAWHPGRRMLSSSSSRPRSWRSGRCSARWISVDASLPASPAGVAGTRPLSVPG